MKEKDLLKALVQQLIAKGEQAEQRGVIMVGFSDIKGVFRERTLDFDHLELLDFTFMEESFVLNEDLTFFLAEGEDLIPLTDEVMRTILFSYLKVRFDFLSLIQ